MPTSEVWSPRSGPWGTLYRRPGPGPAVLFLPGLGCPATQWTAHAAEHLPEGWDLTVWEAPGAGATPFEAASQSGLDDLARSLVEGLSGGGEDLTRPGGGGTGPGRDAGGPGEDLDEPRDDPESPGPWSLVAHSMGGLVALLLCEARPELAASFFNVEGNLGPADCIFTAEVVRRPFDEFRTSWLPDAVERLGRAEEPGTRQYAAALAALVHPEAYYVHSRSTVEHSNRPDLSERFRSLECPKLYVHGSRSGDPDTLAALRRACGVMTIPGADHFPHLDRPDLFYREVEAFIRDAS